jgi:hypothetical protein
MYLSQLQGQFWSIVEWAHHHHLLQGDILCYSVHYVMYLSKLQCQFWSIVEWTHHHHLLQGNILCYGVHYVMYLSKLQWQFWSIVIWAHHHHLLTRQHIVLSCSLCNASISSDHSGMNTSPSSVTMQHTVL